MNEADIMDHLRAEVEVSGPAVFARKHGFSHSYISDVMALRRKPSERLMTALGVKKIVTYKKVKV